MIDSKQAARLRHRKSKGAKLKPTQERALAEYDEKIAARKAGKDKDPQASPETGDAGAAPQTSEGSSPPSDHVPEAGAAPADTTADEPIEAPPPVVNSPAASSSSSSRDWRDKYRGAAGPAADGREMLCVFIGSQWRDGLKAMEEDLALVGVKPVVPADALFPVIVLALDQLLPDRAKLTPPIAAAVGSTITTVQRFRHHKKIVEVQKSDGTLDDYKRKAAADAQRRKAAAEHAQEAELVNEPAKPAAPETAAPPPAPAPTLEQVKTAPPTAIIVTGPGIAGDGRPYG